MTLSTEPLLPRERVCERECEVNKKYQCYPDADQPIIAPLPSNPSSPSPSWKHAGGIQIPPAGPQCRRVTRFLMTLQQDSRSHLIYFSIHYHNTHIIFHHHCHDDITKSNVHASAVAPVGLAVSGNICQRQSLPHGVKVRLARACRVKRSSRNGSEGPPSSLSGWADVNWPGALGDVDGWGTFGVQGFWSRFCQWGNVFAPEKHSTSSVWSRTSRLFKLFQLTDISQRAFVTDSLQCWGITS